MINKKKLLLYLFLVPLIAIFFSLSSIYLYYGSFQHNRYFSTIGKVEDTEIGIIQGFAKIEGIGSRVEKNIDSYKKIFDGLNNKLPIRILLAGEEIYSNILSIDEIKARNDLRYHWEGLRKKPQQFPLGDSEYIIEIDKYIPPKWSSEFVQWLKQPQKWFSPRFDLYTAPFLIFIALWFLLIYSLLFAWLQAYRHKYLSDEIKDLFVEVTNSK